MLVAGLVVPTPDAVRVGGGGYGSPAFTAASESIRCLRARSERMMLGLLGAGIVLRQTPWLDLALSDTEAGLRIHRLLGAGACLLPGGRRLRVGQGVLTVPDSRAAYLAGGRRRPLRKKLARAQALGLRIDAVDDRGRRRLSVELVPHLAGTNGWSQEPLGPDDLCLVARDRTGRAVAAAVVIVDGTVALLSAHVSVRGLEGQSEARYALHTEAVCALIPRGVRSLCTVSPSALRLPPGVQQFQHQTGYELAHLVWRVPRPASPPRPRPDSAADAPAQGDAPAPVLIGPASWRAAAPLSGRSR